MNASQADRVAALERLSDSELDLLGIGEKPVYVSRLLIKLERLANGELGPKTEAQQHFISACNRRCPADTPYEIAFLKFRSALTEIVSKKVKRLPRWRSNAKKTASKKDEHLARLDAQAAEQLDYIEKERREWRRRDNRSARHYDPADRYR